jgi:hypothetical protein
MLASLLKVIENMALKGSPNISLKIGGSEKDRRTVLATVTAASPMISRPSTGPSSA